jgi:hypothetical protein
MHLVNNYMNAGTEYMNAIKHIMDFLRRKYDSGWQKPKEKLTANCRPLTLQASPSGQAGNCELGTAIQAPQTRPSSRTPLPVRLSGR